MLAARQLESNDNPLVQFNCLTWKKRATFAQGSGASRNVQAPLSAMLPNSLYKTGKRFVWVQNKQNISMALASCDKQVEVLGFSAFIPSTELKTVQLGGSPMAPPSD